MYAIFQNELISVLRRFSLKTNEFSSSLSLAIYELYLYNTSYTPQLRIALLLEMKHPGLKGLTSGQPATRAFLARLHYSFFVIWLYRSKCAVAGKFRTVYIRSENSGRRFQFSPTETVFSSQRHSM